MKRCFTILSLLVALPAFAESGDVNPMFGADNENSIALYVGQGTGPGSLFKLVDPFLWEFEPMTNLMVQYSQPASIFRLPSRINLAFVQNFGYGHDRGLSFMAVGMCRDNLRFRWRLPSERQGDGALQHIEGVLLRSQLRFQGHHVGMFQQRSWVSGDSFGSG